VIRFEELADKASGKRVNAEEKVFGDDEWEDDEAMEVSDDEEEEEEAPQLLSHTESSAPQRERIVDQDGFTLVRGKNRR
jgi:pre-rRNA-processing protein TSR2